MDTTPNATETPTDMLRVSTSDNKYTVIQDESGRTRALRYGEEWRECVGDNLVLSLAYDLAALRAENAELWEERGKLKAALEQLKEIHKEWQVSDAATESESAIERMAAVVDGALDELAPF